MKKKSSQKINFCRNIENAPLSLKYYFLVYIFLTEGELSGLQKRKDMFKKEIFEETIHIFTTPTKMKFWELFLRFRNFFFDSKMFSQFDNAEFSVWMIDLYM